MNSLRTRLAAVAAGVVILVTGAAPAATARSAAPIPPGAVGPFQVKSLYNGRCLDEPWTPNGAGNGTQLQLWDCYGRGQYNQHWYLLLDQRGVQLGLGQRFLLINRHSGRCLDAVWNGPNGLPVVVWDCYYRFDNANQLWRVYASGPSRPGVIADLNGRVVDANLQRIGANGTPIQLWDNYGPGQRNQQWILEANF